MTDRRSAIRIAWSRLHFILLLLLSGCTTPGAIQPEPTATVLRVVILPQISYAPFHIAQQEGFFAEQALEVELVKFSKSVEALPALIQGQLDVIAGALSVSSLNAIARGANIRIVADKGHDDPDGCAYRAIVARPALIESGALQSVADLSGLRISMDAANYEGFAVEALLGTAGLNLDAVEIASVPTSAESEALRNGSIDLAATSEPWVTRSVQSGNGTIWKPIHEHIPEFQFTFILYGPTLLEEMPDVGKRFMVAYLKGVRQYNQGKTERNLDILVASTELDRDLLESMCWPPIHDDGRISTRSIVEFQNWALDKGLLDNTVREDQFWDPSFVEYANEILRKTD